MRALPSCSAISRVAVHWSFSLRLLSACCALCCCCSFSSSLRWCNVCTSDSAALSCSYSGLICSASSPCRSFSASGANAVRSSFALASAASACCFCDKRCAKPARQFSPLCQCSQASRASFSVLSACASAKTSDALSSSLSTEMLLRFPRSNASSCSASLYFSCTRREISPYISVPVSSSSSSALSFSCAFRKAAKSPCDNIMDLVKRAKFKPVIRSISSAFGRICVAITFPLSTSASSTSAGCRFPPA